MESPSPVPFPASFVVKKGLNILDKCCGAMPLPLSFIDISTILSSPFNLVSITISFLSLLASNNSIWALFNRFKITCCNCIKLPFIFGNESESLLITSILLTLNSCSFRSNVSNIILLTSTGIISCLFALTKDSRF